MANSKMDNGIPSLNGPDDHHAYIDYCPQQDMATRKDQYTPTDSDVATKTTQMLENKRVKCLLRGRDFSTQKGELRNVKDSIDRCKKVVFIISKNYLGNSWFKTVSDYTLKKMRARNQMASFIGILVDVGEADLPDYLASLYTMRYDDPDIWDNLFKLVTSDEKPRMDRQAVGETDIASALAWPYFYGYLDLVLPKMAESIKKNGFWSEDRERRTMPLKLFIIIPESCFCPPNFSDYDPKIDDDGWVACNASRAGNPHRDYRCSIHKIKDQDGKVYHFVGEFATPILSLWQMAEGNLCGVTPLEIFHHLSLFYYTIENILPPELKKKVTFVYYKDKAEPREPLSNILLNKIKEEIREDVMQEKFERMSVRNQDIDQTGAASSAVPMETESQDPARRTAIPSELGSHYVGLDHVALIPSYKMIHKPRGLALIINNRKFKPNGDMALGDREGAQHDEEILANLFKDLNMEVDTHRDLTSYEMENVMQDAARKDHSLYDCFVCCILTHGNLGIVYGSDCRPLEITELVSFFKDDCESLRNKPKAFFVQACQTSHLHGVGDGPVAQSGVLQSDAGIAELPTTQLSNSTLVPGACDYLMSYSTIPGHYSYRISDQGSLYVLALDQNLRKYRNIMDIDNILRLVTKDVREAVCRIDSGLAGSQFPFHLSTMQNLLYFK